MKNLVQLIQNLGLSEKAAEVYLASLELGETTIQTLAEKANQKRTTVYYTIEELIGKGAIIETKRNKKIYYMHVDPLTLLKRAKQKILEVEDAIDLLEERKHAVYKKPRIYFLYGPSGFKQIWDMVFRSKLHHFNIITAGENFLDFVKEKYILDDIIKTKKESDFFSKQLIVDSLYARKIIAKDSKENRISKVLPAGLKLPFTEIICKEFVAFISPRMDNVLFVVESESFAETREELFETMWQKID